jgi:signal transduction histidine kinase
VFYSAAISGQVISTAESTCTILFGVVSIFGSAALFFFMAETIYAVPLGLFLLGFGALMVVVAWILKQAIRTAIALRIRAEQISSDLEGALVAAREERAARTRFVAAISHDLRQPLQAASLFAQTAAHDGLHRAEALDGLRRALGEATGLVDNMAQHLRIESGAITPRTESLPIAPLLAALQEELAPVADRAHVDLRCLARSDAVASADPALSARILRNLVHNAIIHARCTRIRVLARQREATEICVIDDGIGLDLNQAEAYLAPYSQGPSSRGHGPGTGLGLSIARDLAQLMAGQIALLPGAGCGLRVRLTLPAAPCANAPQVRAARPLGGTLAGRRILVIDDHAVALAAVEQWCRLKGAAEVHIAQSEAEARALLHQGVRPDLVLSDWHLCGATDSTALIAELRQTVPDLVVIVMTGDTQPSTQESIAALGLPMVFKPFDDAKLAEALEDLASEPC